MQSQVKFNGFRRRFRRKPRRLWCRARSASEKVPENGGFGEDRVPAVGDTTEAYFIFGALHVLPHLGTSNMAHIQWCRLKIFGFFPGHSSGLRACIC